MDYFRITGGRPLRGTLRVHGAKNSALPLLAATLLAEGESILRRCPDLTDVRTALSILACLGCRVCREGDAVRVDTSTLAGCQIPDGLMGRMRASVLFLGALLARTGQARSGWPGGCALGARPIDLHIRAFQALGARVLDREGGLFCESPCLRGRRLCLPLPSVGATENAMLCACGACGVTEICNAAREPEIADLQGFLRAMGAEVTGGGTDRVIIRGGRPLRPADYSVMPDRIVAATALCAVASAGGEGELMDLRPRDLEPVLAALEAAGCRILRGHDRVCIRAEGPLRGIGRLTTGPWPGFPTDAQPLLAAALAGGEGVTEIVETVFERRFRYAAGLRAMGADLTVEGSTARVTGRPLHGAAAEAPDLRGGAALTIAALGARGESRITGLPHIDRGYRRLEEDLGALGADIRRVRGRNRT